MLRHARWAVVPAIVVGWLLAAGPACAQNRSPARKVLDEAGMFSPAAMQKANEEIADINRLYHKDLLVETVTSAPADIKSVDPKNKSAMQRYFESWAIRRAENERVDGVYVLICKDP